MKVAIIGLGEVGCCFARALGDAGLAVTDACARRPSQRAREMAAADGIVLHAAPGPWLAGADLVISAVVGAAALGVARACLAFMAPGAVLADLTTARPQDMRLVGDDAGKVGVLFVDVAIMGGITLSGARTPLLCAGSGAEAFAAALAPLGGRVRVLKDGKAGDAVTLKLLRSIFVKGMEALAVECLSLAESAGLRTELYENLMDIDEARLSDFLDMLVRTHVVHAARRLHEVESAEAQLRQAGFEPRVTSAVRTLFDRTRRSVKDRTVDPGISVEDALSVLIASARQAQP